MEGEEVCGRIRDGTVVNDTIASTKDKPTQQYIKATLGALT